MSPRGTTTEEDELYGLGDRNTEHVVPPMTPLMQRIYAFMKEDTLYTTRGIWRPLMLSKGSVDSALNAMVVKYAVDKETTEFGTVVWRKR